MSKTLTETSISTPKNLTVLEAIYKRRAIRKYKDETVSLTIIEQILDAGRMAPSAINKQPWRFYVLTKRDTIQFFSKEIMKAVGKDFVRSGPTMVIKTIANLLHFPHGLISLKNADPIFHGAPVVIFITAPKDNEWAALDIGMCAQNMMLAATSLGWDTCPIGFGKYVAKAEHFSQLNIPESEQVHLALILGRAGEAPELHVRTKNNVSYID